MKIGIFSDTHLGFAEKSERFEESFQNLEQAINLCVEEKVDAIILPGDVFDAPVPSHTVLFKSMHSFALARKGFSDVRISLEKNGEVKGINFSGIPILAIHGNHEFKSAETKTALDVLNLAGLVVYFHAGKICIEKPGGENVFIFGLGAVPEKKALEVLQYWQPKPVNGFTNILMLHQGFKEFMAVEDEMVATLSLDDLPKGFDLAVNGHLHWSNMQKLGDSIFLLAGSTITTAVKKLEAEKPKGVFFFDSVSKEISFEPFPLQRKVFYHKIVFENSSAENVLSECAEAISADLQLSNSLKPLIRLNLKGTLLKGLSPADVNLKEVFDSFSGNAILSISKNFSTVSFKARISELHELQKSKLSIASLGFQLLEKNLGQTGLSKNFPSKELFDLLAEDETEKAFETLFPKS